MSSASGPPPVGISGPRQRKRSISSLSDAIDDVASPSLGDAAEAAVAAASKTIDKVPTTADAKATELAREKAIKSQGFFWDLLTFRWMTNPLSSLKLASLVVALHSAWTIAAPSAFNPFRAFVLLSHRVPTAQVLLAEPKLALSGALSGDHLVRYQKGYWDLAFVGFYVIVFSFLRQSTTLYLFKPFAKWWGIKNEVKQARFMEQGYSFLYWGTAGILGVYVMSFQESWWYKTEHFWLKYPHWIMRPELKAYYLLQASYWLQQALVMLLRLEKPRKDYYELIAHHLVTLWLIYWSYLINLTMIGTTVFVCMDIPDTYLALAKGINYLGVDTVATVIFIFFMCTWTYFRLYLSALTLWSVWTQFDFIPEHTKEWNPPHGWWMVWWMKYQVFTPLFLLLLLNIFWYVLAWRVMIRAVQGVVKDDREEGEYDEGEEETADKKK